MSSPATWRILGLLLTKPGAISHRQRSRDCLEHSPLLLRLKPCVKNSFRALFAKLTHFLFIRNGIIPKKIPRFTLDAGKPTGDSQINGSSV